MMKSNNLIRKLLNLRVFSGLLRLVLSNRNGLRIIAFHDIPEEEEPVFAEYIKWLSHEFNIISPREISENVSKPNTVLLTFDDGYQSNYKIAKKYLDPAGIKAIFFIIPEFINLNMDEAKKEFICDRLFNKMSPDRVPDKMRPFGWVEAKELIDNGHSIGAHTLSHRMLSEIENESELVDEISGSADYLEEKLGVDISHFAIPNGKLSYCNAKSLRECFNRYKFIYTTISAVNSAGTLPVLHRVSVGFSEGLEYSKIISVGGLDMKYRKQLTQFEKLIKNMYEK